MTQNLVSTQESNNKLHPWAIFLFLLVAAVFVAAFPFLLEGHMSKVHWVSFYLFAAMVAGFGFWAIEPGHKHWFSTPLLRLSGGAAVGLAYVFIISELSPLDTDYIVRTVPSETYIVRPAPGVGSKYPKYQILSDSLNDIAQFRTSTGQPMLYVRFLPNSTKGAFSVEYPDIKNEGFVKKQYCIRITGDYYEKPKDGSCN